MREMNVDGQPKKPNKDAGTIEDANPMIVKLNEVNQDEKKTNRRTFARNQMTYTQQTKDVI